LPIVGLAKERDVAEGEGATATPVAPEAVATGLEAAVVVDAAVVEATVVGAASVETAVIDGAVVETTVVDVTVAATTVADPAVADASVGEGAPSSPAVPSKRRRGKTVAPDRRSPDRIFLPHAKDAIPIRPSSAEMFVLQHLRDEAHRFAVAFHRRRRGKLTLRSALADVPGIGPGRQRALLRHFGSLKKIRDATLEELAAVPGVTATAAAAVFAHLGKGAAGGAPMGSEPPPSEDAEDEVLENAFADIEEDTATDDTPLETDDPPHPLKGQEAEVP
jgi:hypothetical protein